MPGAHEHACFRIVAANRHARELRRNSVVGQFNEPAGLFQAVILAVILRVCDFFGFISVSISRSLSLSRERASAPGARGLGQQPQYDVGRLIDDDQAAPWFVILSVRTGPTRRSW